MKDTLTAALFVLTGSLAFGALAAVYLGWLGIALEPKALLTPIGIGGLTGLVGFFLHIQTDLMKSRLVHLNLVLKTIRDVNHLMTRERDRVTLFQGICDILVENRGYNSAWIALRNEGGQWVSFAESGLGEMCKPLSDRFHAGDIVPCSQKALSQDDIVVTAEPAMSCGDCSLAIHYRNNAALSSRIEYNGHIYGVITLSIPKALAADAEEQALVKEIADDIAYGLFNLEIREQREQTERELRVSMDALSERIKELNCLFGLSRLVEQRGITLKEILQGVIDLIPPAWQYPEITCARIQFDTDEFMTDPFRETGWRLEKEIIVNNQPAGNIMVCYLEKKPERDEGPFLIEERELINALAERLGRIIEREKAEEELLTSERRFRKWIENSLTGISIVQDNQVVYQNKEQERLLGPLPRSHVLGDYENIHPDDLGRVKKLSHDFFAGQSEALDVEFRYSLKGDPDQSIWIHCRAHNIEYRQKKAVLVNMMDTTQIKELEKMLLVQDRMASLGRVAAGIAHEIRNPLSGINIYVNTFQKLIQKDESPEKIQSVTQQILAASRKIESVIRRVMDFSKPGKPNYIVTDVNQPVQEALNLTAVTLRKSNIHLEQQLGENLPKCRLDPQQIEEVVLNLLNNAVDAIRSSTGEKRIKVTTSLEDKHVMLRVLDSGPGIDIADKDRVFDPFVTSKSDSTGIGLSICQRIISDHGGTVAIQTSPWGGAEFCISIPTADVPADGRSAD
jgi:PAS domain S-box-containing protein